MISRIERSWRAAIAGIALAALGACGAAEPELPPLEAARAMLARGDGVGAEILLRELLDEGTPREELAAYMGEAELEQGRPIEARGWLEPGVFSQGTHGHGFRMLGLLEMRAGNLPAAGAAFDRALETDPDNPELWVAIGRLRYSGGEQTQAVEASKRAVALGPDNVEALRFRGQLVRDAFGMAAALPWFEAALERDGDDIDLLADYAATLGEAGRAKDMLAVVRRMAAVAPRDPRIAFYQATLAARARQFELARGLLARRTDIDQQGPAVALLSGVVDLESGNPASAAQTFDRLLRAQPDNRRVRQLLALALRRAGNDRELVYRFADAATRPDAEPYFAQTIGRAYEALGERDKAAPLLASASRARPTELVPLPTGIPAELVQGRGRPSGEDARALVRGFIGTGRMQAAIDAVESFRAKFPGSADALGLAGDAYLAAGEPRRALERYRSAAKIRRPWPLARRMLAAHAMLGDVSGAEALLTHHFAGEPANREAASLLALLAFDARQWERGEFLLEHSLANGGAHDPRLLALAARIALRRNDTDEARELAARAYRLQRRNAAASAALVEALYAAGEDDIAAALSAAQRR